MAVDFVGSQLAAARQCGGMPVAGLTLGRTVSCGVGMSRAVEARRTLGGATLLTLDS